MCNARPCQERRARAQAQAQALKANPQVAQTARITPKAQTKTTVKSPITHITKRGK